MPVTIEGTIQVRDNHTGQIHTINGQDIDLDVVETEERSMGPELTHSGTYDINDTVSITVEVDEYPLGTNNGHRVHVEGATIVADNLQISVDSDDSPDE